MQFAPSVQSARIITRMYAPTLRCISNYGQLELMRTSSLSRRRPADVSQPQQLLYRNTSTSPSPRPLASDSTPLQTLRPSTLLHLHLQRCKVQNKWYIKQSKTSTTIHAVKSTRTSAKSAYVLKTNKNKKTKAQ